MQTFIKSLFVLIALVALAVPFLLEYVAYRRDRAKKICYKRFRVIVYTAGYLIVITIVLCLLTDLLSLLGSLPLVQSIVSALAIGSRTEYFVRVFTAVFVNVAVGLGYWLIGRFVRIGIGKASLTEPKKADGQFTRRQMAERKAVRFFYGDAWFFVAKVLKYLAAILSAVYLLLFAVWLIFGVADVNWPPYDFISMIFGAGVNYPVIVLLALWEMYFFLAGVQRLEEECPELLGRSPAKLKKYRTDLKTVDSGVRGVFKDYYVRDLKPVKKGEELASTSHDPVTAYIKEAIRHDKPEHQLYLNAADKLVGGTGSLLINGNFFSPFSMYLLRYLSAILARGDSIIFVCNSDAQIDAVHDYLVQGFSEISSLKQGGGKHRFDHPIWRIVKVSGERSVVEEAGVDDANVLVTSLGYLCSDRFEDAYKNFVTFVDIVVFVDMLDTLNKFNRQLAMLNTKLKHIVRKNLLAARQGEFGDSNNVKMRYASRQVRYLCFDDTRTPGLDKVVKSMLGVTLDTTDAMYYSPSTAVRFYNFEGRLDENGRRSCPQIVDAGEEVGVVMSLAQFCLLKGAGNVTVFADDVIPYANILETISSNIGGMTVNLNADKIRINKRFCDPRDYSVVIAVDSGDNLPAVVRRYMSILSGSEALLIIVSKPYMLRDYYLDNIDAIWRSSQIQRIPVEVDTERNMAQRILVKAGEAGIFASEVIRLAESIPRFSGSVARRDVNAILCEVLKMNGVPEANITNVFNYFEYAISQTFDDAGKFNSDVRIILRRDGNIYDTISGRNMIIMTVGDAEMTLSLPRSRITQNYIAEQNFVHNGSIYHILNIDVPAGRLSARLALGGTNEEVYRYVQARTYRIELGDAVERVGRAKHIVLDRDSDTISVSDAYISVERVPMEVLTSGYYDIDPHTLAYNNTNGSYHIIDEEGKNELALQTYRRYGALSSPVYSSDRVLRKTTLNASEKGALVMRIKVTGKFGENVKKMMQLAAVMFNELLRSMFPSVADAIAVCPVLEGSYAGEDAASVLRKQPRLIVDGGDPNPDGGFELVIIEDCRTNLGVISALMSSGDNMFVTLFRPLLDYLRWYRASAREDGYLRFGLDHDPDCFDFEGLEKLAGLLADDKHDVRVVEVGSLVEYEVCDFCGNRYPKGDDILVFEDGRKICRDCAANLAGGDRKVLHQCLDRARMFLESTYGIALGDDYEVCFESASKIVNTLRLNSGLFKHDADIPLKSYVAYADARFTIHAEDDIPAVNLSELLVRELTRVWLLKHLPEIDGEYAEGLIAIVSVQYLRFFGQETLAQRRATYYESTANLSGKGYRRLVSELLAHTEAGNNPFRYLLGLTGGGQAIVQPLPAFSEESDLGHPYRPAEPDRVKEGELTYFYYPRLGEKLRKVYDALLAAIRAHEDTADPCGCTMDEVSTAEDALRYDHPELFWYKTFGYTPDRLKLYYGASAEEAASLQTRIESAAAEYLKGITDEMSAYDVALRIHLRVISSVDYDTIALNKQKEEGGTAKDEIDYLRTICGVFLNRAAVCEGYARAVQYLLQRCGVECAEAVGEIAEDGGGHAWNIVKIDGDYYYMDTTWDDSSNTIQKVKSRDCGFAYFCITSEEVLRTRDTKGSPVEMPVCTATRANYYTHNGLVLERYDLEKLKQIAADATRRKSSAITFKCADKPLYEQALSRLFKEGSDWSEVLKAAVKADRKIVDGSVTYSSDSNLRTITMRLKRKSDDPEK